MNDLAPMKDCPGGLCKVGQISSRGIIKSRWHGMTLHLKNINVFCSYVQIKTVTFIFATHLIQNNGLMEF